MFGLRADVGTMKNIIRFFHRYRRSGGDDLAQFAEQYLQHRYSMRGFDRERSEVMHEVALMALPFYCEELNADKSVSLLALLGAVSETERFVIDPGIVMRKAAGWKHRDLWGTTIGAAGIADISAALQRAEQRFQEHTAAMTRLQMGFQ